MVPQTPLLVCLGHQFSDGVRFATFSTPHFLHNMARAKNCKWQAQGHTDGAFDWCGKEVALISFGMNSMGAHFNPVSFSIVNSESKEGIKNSYLATCAGLYSLYNGAALCEDAKCGFCTQIKAQVTDPTGMPTVWQQQLLSEDAKRGHYQLDNPSSDNSGAYFATGKELFGPATAIGQCGHHLSCKLHVVPLFQFKLCDSDGAAIAWRRKCWRKYFDSEDNFAEFHQLAGRLLAAPTLAIAHTLQAQIGQWLKSVKETRAASWFKTYWTGEHGNYTNASAGYVGNNKSNGCESHWKYMRRDTIGVAGSNKRMPLKIWVPLLVKYLEDLSKRHAEKVWCATTKVHCFPTVPVIDTEMWAKFHKFDVERILMSHPPAGPGRQGWEDTLDFFYDLRAKDMNMSFAEMIHLYREAGRRPTLSRTTLGEVYMPTMKTVLELRRAVPRITTLTDADAAVIDRLDCFNVLFNHTAEYTRRYPDATAQSTLDIMEGFVRVKALEKQVGDMVFLCCCTDAYQCYTCVDAIVLSMIFNPDLEVPDNLRKKQIKDRERAQLATPFTTKEQVKRAKAKAKEAAEKAVWKPTFSTFTAPQGGSALAMAMAKRAGPGPQVQGPPPPAASDGAADPQEDSDSELDKELKPGDRRRSIASKMPGRGKPVLPGAKRGAGRPTSGVRCHLRAGLACY